MTTNPPLRRLIWRHTNSGVVPIAGSGLTSNTQGVSPDDAEWLTDMFPELEFRCEEWNHSLGQWVEVGNDN